MKEMWTFNKKKSRLLAGFMALVLVFSNIAANVQTVYAFGPAFHLGDNGEWESAGNQDSDGSGDLLDDMGAGVTADDAGAYDFYVSIWPEMEKSEDAENEEAEEDAAAAETWTGKWLQYMYDGQETDHTLGQELLMSGKYEEEYGPLDMNLPGTWEGDNDEVMEVYPDGTALVKDEGIVNVTFTYEGEAVTAAAAEDVPAEGSGTAAPSEEATVSGGEENVAGEGQTVGDPQTVSDEQPADGETAETVTTAAEETEAETESTAEAESEAGTETETETVVETEAETETEAEAETEVETETEAEAETEVETETETEAETTVSADVSTAAPENEEETESAAVKETEAEATESSTEVITEGEVPLAALDSDTAPTEVASEDSSDETESVPEATGNNAIQPETPEVSGTPEASETPEVPAEENKKTLEPGTVLTWAVCVKYSGTALIDGNSLICDKDSIPESDWVIGDGNHNVVVTGIWHGTITYNGSGTMTIRGGGTIDASGRNRSAITVTNGAKIVLEDATVTGGMGTVATGEVADLDDRGSIRVGGGVYVENGTFNLQGGTIRDNKAQRGGGIFVNKGANFNMTGGTVESNQTVDTSGHTSGDNYNLAGEGGGIFVWGTAYIEGGRIINNICGSKTDLGGGGLYVNNNGKATLVNAKVTNNTAYGYGGGIAGCVHGEASLVAIDGLALYDNTAIGTSYAHGKYTDDMDNDDKDYADRCSYFVDFCKSGHVKSGGKEYTWKGSMDVMKLGPDDAKDLYTAGSTIVGNYMAGGGSEQYTAWIGNYSNGNFKTVKIQDSDVVSYEEQIVGLTANPSAESKESFPDDEGDQWVDISGNISYVHGGGIGCNGGLYFGSKENQEVTFNVLDLKLGAVKKLNDGKTNPPANKYEFVLLYSNGDVAATAKNDASGNVEFCFNSFADLDKYFDTKEPAQITFYLREKIPANPEKDASYDKSLYKLVVTLKKDTTSTEKKLEHTTTVTNPNFKNIEVKVVTNTYTVAANGITVYRVNDRDGNPLSSEEKLTGTTPQFDNYTYTPTTYKPIVQKKVSSTIDGTPAPSRTYKFTISAVTQGAPMPDPAYVEITVAGGLPAKEEFNPISYNVPGVYVYHITESDVTDPTIQKDTSEVTLTVNVEAVGGSNLEATGTYSGGTVFDDGIANGFNNQFTVAEITYSPQVKKEFTSSSAVRPKDKKFNFDLEDVGKLEQNPDDPSKTTYKKANGYTMPTEVSVEVTGETTGEFGAIEFSELGDYYFTITEQEGSDPGYTYDQAVKELHVEVRYNKDQGILEATPYYDDVQVDHATVTNTYEVKPTYFAPEVMKIVYGDDQPAEDRVYTFTLAEGLWYPNGGPGDDGAKLPEESTVTITGAGRKKFDEIKFTKAGIYNFEIREEDESNEHYIYDDTVWNVEVTIEDNESQLEVKAVKYTKTITGTKTNNVGPVYSNENPNVAFASFYNEYRITPTDTQLHVTKYVTGSVRPEINTATFNFRLALLDATARNGAKLPEKQTVSITGSGKPGKLGEAYFDKIEFSRAGTYIFEIDEMTGFEAGTERLPGYTYDNGTWHVIVTVVDNKGELKVASTQYVRLENGVSVDTSDVPEEEGARFVNDYDVLSTKYAPKVNKEFARDAAARPTEKTFTFTLEPKEDYGTNITFSEETIAKTVTVKGAGIAAFDNITFNEAGTYKFIISETDSGEGGYTYDPKKWELTVEIVDTGNQLIVNTTSYAQIDGTESAGGMATFTNDYKVTPTVYQPEVSKVLTGEERPIEKTFRFGITEGSYTPPAYALALKSGLTMPESREVSVTGAGTTKFDELKFEEPGTYTFLIEEADDKENGYTYDAAKWTLTVLVEDLEGQLTVTETKYEAEGKTTSSTEATFTNDYQVKPISFVPEVKKSISGTPLWDETFDFALEAAADNKEGGVEFTNADSAKHVTVTGAGTAKFDDITFRKAGKYTFTIRETAGNSPYWTYDDRSWTLTVNIVDDDSWLKVESWSYASNKGETTTEAAEFENEFTMPGELRIGKTVTGNAGEVRRDFHFTVTLTDQSGNPLKGSYNYTGSSIYGSEDAPADGVITDGVVTVTLRHGQEITFHYIPAGTSYRVEEAEADTEGYRTTLTLDGNGQAVAAAEGTIPIDGTSVVEYENYRYQPTGGTTPDRPGTNIPDNEVPQSPGTPDIITISDEPTPLSNFETIEDEDVPLAFLAPMTGDNKPVGAAALFGLLALGMMGAFGILASKKDEEDA